MAVTRWSWAVKELEKHNKCSDDVRKWESVSSKVTESWVAFNQLSLPTSAVEQHTDTWLPIHMVSRGPICAAKLCQSSVFTGHIRWHSRRSVQTNSFKKTKSVKYRLEQQDEEERKGLLKKQIRENTENKVDFYFWMWHDWWVEWV